MHLPYDAWVVISMGRKDWIMAITRQTRVDRIFVGGWESFIGYLLLGLIVFFLLFTTVHNHTMEEVKSKSPDRYLHIPVESAT